MHLGELFELQKHLQLKIDEKRKCENKIELLKVAISVEIAELFNEWKGFKYWSISKEIDQQALFTEYADGLHMILALGVALDIHFDYVKPDETGDIYNKYFNILHILSLDIFGNGQDQEIYYFERLLSLYLGIANDLQIKESNIIYSFCMKNAINLKRLEEGY